MIRKTPDGASIAEITQGARLHAPAAERNAAPIADLIKRVAPRSGSALEIASGTGQHVTAMAAATPDLLWHPTDVAEDRLASIDAYAADSTYQIAPARYLDATVPGWSTEFSSMDFVFLSNLLHLISVPEAKMLIAETAMALGPNGKFLIYGPFKRNGALTSPGDQSFHESLRRQDPEIGYKDIADVIRWAADCKMAHAETHAMPANNLALEFKKVP